MHTVIKGTKTIAEYKQVQEDMQEKARAYFDAHKAGCEEWTHGLPEKIWREGDVLCIEYADGNWWHCEHSHRLRLRLEAGVSASRLSFPALPGDLFRDGCDHPPRRCTG